MREPLSGRTMTGNAGRLLICAAVGFMCLVAALFIVASREEVTTSMPSPDGWMRAILVDRPNLPSIDRNFRVRIERVDGVAETVFTSPDEAPSGIGSERFLWSKDGTRLLLIGKRFWVRDGVKLRSGEVLYFLYDLRSEKAWCNSDCGYGGFEPFGMAELTGYNFGEALSLCEPESNDQPQGRAAPDQPDG